MRSTGFDPGALTRPSTDHVQLGMMSGSAPAADAKLAVTGWVIIRYKDQQCVPTPDGGSDVS